MQPDGGDWESGGLGAEGKGQRSGGTIKGFKCDLDDVTTAVYPAPTHT